MPVVEWSANGKLGRRTRQSGRFLFARYPGAIRENGTGLINARRPSGSKSSTALACLSIGDPLLCLRTEPQPHLLRQSDASPQFKKARIGIQAV